VKRQQKPSQKATEGNDEHQGTVHVVKSLQKIYLNIVYIMYSFDAHVGTSIFCYIKLPALLILPMQELNIKKDNPTR